MTNHTNHLFGKYEVRETATGYTLTGKRGATYTTYQNRNSATVQFRNQHGRFVAIEGNYTLPTEFVAKHVVTFTDADRVA